MKFVQISYDDVAIRDEQLQQIQDLILLKENMLINKKKEVRSHSHPTKSSNNESQTHICHGIESLQ